MQCKNCGENIQDGCNFCPECGQKVVLDDDAPDDKETNNSSEENHYIHNNFKIKRSKTAIILISAFFVIIAALGIATEGAAPLRAKHNINLGIKYVHEGKYEEAILAYKNAISIDKKNVDVRLSLAKLYVDAGQNENAKELLKETLLLDKSNQGIYLMLADIYKKEKNYVELVKLLSEGTSLCRVKDKIKSEFDILISQINISDIKASVSTNEKYELPKAVQVQIGEDKFELPVKWNKENVDTSKTGSEKIEGTIEYINKPITLYLNVEVKPAEVTEKKIAKKEATYSFDFTLPVISMEGQYSGNAAKLNSMIEKDFNKFQTDNLKNVEEESKESYRDYGAGYHFSVGYEVKYNKKGLISILMTFYCDTGGVHGYAYEIAYNYDLINGKELKLQDVFRKDVNAYNLVKDEVVKQMLADRNQYFDDGIAAVKSRREPFNFYFSDKGVVIFFGEYEIAPYSSGMPEFLITKNTVIS